MINTEVKQPRRLRAPKLRLIDVWETNDRRLLYMPDMDDSHLESALRLMLGMRMDERKYAKGLKTPYEMDPELNFRINQLLNELARRAKPEIAKVESTFEPKGFWARLFGRG